VTDQEIVAVREIYWNIDPTIGSLALYTMAILTSLAASWGILRDIARWRQGKPALRIDQPWRRLRGLLQQSLGQQRVLRDRSAGVMHGLIFFGFLALFIGTDIIAVEEDFTIPLLGDNAGKILVGGFYQAYELILDSLGLVFLAGLIWAVVRRYRIRPTRLDNRRTDAWAVGVLLFLAVGGFLIEGLRLANQQIGGVSVYQQEWARLAFVGYAIAGGLRAIGLGDGSPIALALHQLLWFSHAGATFAFLGSLPFSKFRHILYTPLNGFFRDLGPAGALDPIPQLEAEIEKDEPQLGVATLADMSWKRRMDLDACMRCGRCQAVCPAHASGALLSPKYLISKLADFQRGDAVQFKDGSSRVVGTTAERETLPLVGNLIAPEELWACTTCNACVYECPALIEHVDDIVDMRRNLTMIQSEVPAGVKRVLEGIERQSNPWRLPARERAAWTAGLDVPTLAEKEAVDVLYWVGCAPSYDERSRKTARAMVQLLEQAGVDYAILGKEECCTGDPARRMGEEMLFQAQAQTAIETMHQYQFKTVVTTCAHCFNAINNEYPQLGGKAGIDYRVVHHTEYLAGLVEQGKLQPQQRVEEKIVYHDPCYIGRYNGVYDAPRELLRSIPGVELLEIGQQRERAMCCGGGGGNVWLEGHGERNVNVIRLEQLTAPQPDTVAVACPFCMVMFEDAAKNSGKADSLQRRDVAEILLESVQSPRA
jgi:Fe-S oxidoreductase